MCRLLVVFVCLLSGAFAADMDFNNILDGFNPKTISEALKSTFLNANLTTPDCKNATNGCLQTEVVTYLEHVVEALKSFDIRELIRFPKNNNTFDDFEETNEVDKSDETFRKDRTPLEELEKRFSKFMFTHDIQINLPDTLFDSNVLQISPRAGKGKEKGIIAQFKILSNKITKGKPRIFHKIKKIGEKLKNAVLALILFFGLAKVLISFLLPLVVGVATAKKILVKVLLFVFPFLAFFFKLCPFTPYGTKFHHHHHHISHAHQLPHTPSFVYHDLKHEHHPHHHDVITGPDYHSEGPAFANELISHRNDPSNPFVGQGQPGAVHRIRNNKPPFNRPLTPNEIEAMVNEAEKEALLKARLQQERLRVQMENKRLQDEIKLHLLRQEKLKAHATNLANGGVVNTLVPPKPSIVLASNASVMNAIQVDSNKISLSPSLQPPFQASVIQTVQRQTIVTPVPQPVRFSTEDPIQKAAAITYDPFYSPILEKIEKILTGLGFVEDQCRERLICSMYKNPVKWSPYSNLVSVELSRDAKDLQKPTYANAAVVKFHRYVQAARDGQDQRNCSKLYSSCPINTDR
ncbi:uncharacterized protein LOC108734517 [Agrilus planipennis]|uniref:Uncharacterized protein LOC108734517 n=1 Tax=Agrilus planipennis TaxID=224129 RepID=A0A1W4WCA2_AGRPL|nr:uncharacterized protein LOC108734517 [Agrilus planipennis]